MSRDEKFFGSLLVLVSVLWTLHIVVETLTSKPDWSDALMALFDLGSGVLITRSVWRDRL